MKKFFKLFVLISCLFLLLFLYTFFFFFSYAQTVSSDIADSVFRLHVIANSDSNEDQNLKYLVRDKLIEYMNSLCSNTCSKEEAMKIANENIEVLQNIAQNVVYENGFNYSVNVNIGKYNFPTKNYGDISLPAGTYDALRVEIGEAKGQNWWCVMFPPLCFVDVTSGIVPEESKEVIKDNLSNEEYNLINNEKKAGFTFKFKILEWFQDNKILTAKK